MYPMHSPAPSSNLQVATRPRSKSVGNNRQDSNNQLTYFQHMTEEPATRCESAPPSSRPLVNLKNNELEEKKEEAKEPQPNRSADNGHNELHKEILQQLFENHTLIKNKLQAVQSEINDKDNEIHNLEYKIESTLQKMLQIKSLTQRQIAKYNDGKNEAINQLRSFEQFLDKANKDFYESYVKSDLVVSQMDNDVLLKFSSSPDDGQPLAVQPAVGVPTQDDATDTSSRRWRKGAALATFGKTTRLNSSEHRPSGGNKLGCWSSCSRNRDPINCLYI